MFMSPACADRSTSILSDALTIPTSALAADDSAAGSCSKDAGPGAGDVEPGAEAGRAVAMAAKKAYTSAWNERVANVLKDAASHVAMEPLLLQSPDVASLLSWAAQVWSGIPPLHSACPRWECIRFSVRPLARDKAAPSTARMLWPAFPEDSRLSCRRLAW